jgi:hypothetical protein
VKGVKVSLLQREKEKKIAHQRSETAYWNMLSSAFGMHPDVHLCSHIPCDSEIDFFGDYGQILILVTSFLLSPGKISPHKNSHCL